MDGVLLPVRVPDRKQLNDVNMFSNTRKGSQLITHFVSGFCSVSCMSLPSLFFKVNKLRPTMASVVPSNLKCEATSCPICYETYTDAAEWCAYHPICLDCGIEMLHRKMDECPICRRPWDHPVPLSFLESPSLENNDVNHDDEAYLSQEFYEYSERMSAVAAFRASGGVEWPYDAAHVDADGSDSDILSSNWDSGLSDSENALTDLTWAPDGMDEYTADRPLSQDW
jgi:hypothetical protein